MTFWSNFWGLAWFFFWAFAFIAYLMILFSIVSDLFRDRKLNGWLKAIWIVFLIWVPFLTALVYLIARGGGMAERSQAQVKRQEEQVSEYIREKAGNSPADEIARAKSLLDAGTITKAEYETLKARALA